MKYQQYRRCKANDQITPSQHSTLSIKSPQPVFEVPDFVQECKQIATFNAIYYIFKACMLLLSSNRVNTQTICPKSNSEQREEHQSQFDPQEYRLLLSILAQNINQTLKTHKDCIGEMEYYPNCKVNREKKEESASYLTEIFRKLKCKLAKESLYRNTATKRTRQKYAQDYHRAFPLLQTEQSLPKQQNIPSAAVLRKLPFSDIDKYRTLSVKNERRSTTGSYQEKMSIQLQTFKTIQADFSTTLALKTISSDNAASKEPFLRSTKSALSRTRRQRRKSNDQLIKNRRSLSIQPQSNNSQDFIFAGNEILISDHRHSGQSHRRQYFKQQISSKVCTKQVVAMNQSHRKIINEIEAMHLHAKRIDFCNALSDDIYAYKPTAKRWQRSFN